MYAGKEKVLGGKKDKRRGRESAVNVKSDQVSIYSIFLYLINKYLFLLIYLIIKTSSFFSTTLFNFKIKKSFLIYFTKNGVLQIEGSQPKNIYEFKDPIEKRNIV